MLRVRKNENCQFLVRELARPVTMDYISVGVRCSSSPNLRVLLIYLVILITHSKVNVTHIVE